MISNRRPRKWYKVLKWCKVFAIYKFLWYICMKFWWYQYLRYILFWYKVFVTRCFVIYSFCDWSFVKGSFLWYQVFRLLGASQRIAALRRFRRFATTTRPPDHQTTRPQNHAAPKWPDHQFKANPYQIWRSRPPDRRPPLGKTLSTPHRRT